VSKQNNTEETELKPLKKLNVLVTNKNNEEKELHLYKKKTKENKENDNSKLDINLDEKLNIRNLRPISKNKKLNESGNNSKIQHEAADKITLPVIKNKYEPNDQKYEVARKKEM